MDVALVKSLPSAIIWIVSMHFTHCQVDLEPSKEVMVCYQLILASLVRKLQNQNIQQQCTVTLFQVADSKRHIGKAVSIKNPY